MLIAFLHISTSQSICWPCICLRKVLVRKLSPLHPAASCPNIESTFPMKDAPIFWTPIYKQYEAHFRALFPERSCTVNCLGHDLNLASPKLQHGSVFKVFCLVSLMSFQSVNIRTVWLKCWAEQPAHKKHLICMTLEGRHHFAALDALIKNANRKKEIQGSICKNSPLDRRRNVIYVPFCSQLQNPNPCPLPSSAVNLGLSSPPGYPWVNIS